MKIKFIFALSLLILVSCDRIKDEDIATSKIELLTKLGEIDDSTNVQTDSVEKNTEKH